MAENEIKKLTELLEKKFDGIEKQFEGVKEEFASVKKEIAATREEVMRHTGVLIEDVRHNLELLAEGIANVNEKLDRGKEEHEGEHARLEKRTLINAADISKLDQRVTRLEGNA